MNKRFISLFLFLCVINIYSEENFSTISDDEMFMEETTTVITEEDSKKSFVESITEQNTVRFGGQLEAGLDTTIKIEENSIQEKSIYLLPKLKGNLFTDINIVKDLRVYGKLNYLYSEQSTIDTMFSVKELFTDFALNENMFFRFGKHSITWGCGYFFSPADIINLSKIDPENPTETVEGPISLRTQIIFPNTQNCLWMYLLPDTNLYFIENTAFAAKYEHLIGNTEFCLGGWYKYEQSPQLMFSFTSTIFDKVNLFGESSLLFSDSVDFNGTIGLMYYFSKPEISVILQYGYNDIHQEALLVNFGKLGTDKLTLALFTMLSEDFTESEITLTGIAYAGLTFTMKNIFAFSVKPYFTFTNSDLSTVLKFSITLGGGKF